MLVRILLDKKNFGVKFLGFFETCMAIGSILMTLIISQVKTKEFSTYKEKTFMNRALALEAFAYLLFGFFGDGYLLLFGAAMLGAGSTWMNVSFFSYMQKTVEKEYYGRVISLIFFVSQIMRPLSFSVFGALTERVPILTMFFGVSGGLFIITIVFKKCFNPKEKKLSRVT